MKKLWILAGVSVMVVLLSATTVFASNSWKGYHWARTVNMLPLSLGDNVSDKWDSSLLDANTAWNVSTVLNNSVDPGRTNPRKCSPASGLVEICNAKYGFNGWLGIASIWISGGEHITKGYVKVNDSYFNTSNYNTPEWRQMVMCQEVGHIFGLGHQDTDFNNTNLNTCMDYTSSPGSNQHPDGHDYLQLEDIYAHLDNYDSWASAPPADEGGGGGGGNGNGKGRGNKGEPPGLVASEWGKAISTDGNGRPNLFELDLGNGNKVLTHVLWAE